jgi:hypothetical protein
MSARPGIGDAWRSTRLPRCRADHFPPIALDAINESWKATDGPQHLRPIAANAQIANSVAIPVKYALTYTPGTLPLNNGALRTDIRW